MDEVYKEVEVYENLYRYTGKLVALSFVETLL